MLKDHGAQVLQKSTLAQEFILEGGINHGLAISNQSTFCDLFLDVRMRV